MSTPRPGATRRPAWRWLLGPALLAAAAGAPLSLSCAGAQPPPPPPPSATGPDLRTQHVAEAEQAFARREEPAELERAIAAWKAAARFADSPEVRVRLARAEHFAAQAAEGAARTERLRRAADEARRALELLGTSEPKACTSRSTTRQSAAAMYWLAESLDDLARDAGILAGADERRRALCLSQRSAELDPGYFFAGPLRLLGRLLAQTPAAAGGDAKASQAAFERAQQIAPGHLANQVDFAASLAVKLQDAAAFEQALETALAAGAGPEEIAPENRLARAKAEKLKASRKVLFR